MLSKEEILGIQLKTEVVILETGTVRIKEFATADREKFEMLALNMKDGKSGKNMKAKLVAISLVNEDNTRVFGDDEIDKIAQLPSTVTEKIFEAVLELNGMDNEAVEVAEGN